MFIVRTFGHQRQSFHSRLAISMDFYLAGMTFYNHDDVDSDSDASVDSKPLPKHPDDWSDVDVIDIIEDEVIVLAGGEKIQDWVAQL